MPLEQRIVQTSVGYNAMLSEISDFLEAGEFSENVVDKWKQFVIAFENELMMHPQRYLVFKRAGNLE